MPLVTISREAAVQRWPVEKNALLTAHSTAIFRSASSRMTSGFLPPISSWNFFIGRDVGMLQQCRADLRAAADHQIEHALWQARAVQDIDQRPGRTGHQIGGLD